MSLAYGLDADGPGIILTDPALTIIRRFQQRGQRDLEGGGQLFARFENRNVVVVEATAPTSLDKRTRFGFQPNRQLQREEIKARHSRGLHFVGDWHTHPQIRPIPSTEDIRSMRDCFRRSVHELQSFLMLIAGTAPFPDGLYIALVDDQRVQLLQEQSNESQEQPSEFQNESKIGFT